MRTLGATLVATSIVLLSSVFAQSQAARAIPRLMDGKPDMQGYWTNQTFTPLERPAQFKDKEYFSAEEAASLFT